VSLAVLDASVVVLTFLPDDPRHETAVSRLTKGDSFYAPALLDIEVVSALRSLARVHSFLGPRVPALIRGLAMAPISRESVTPELLTRAWELRENVTSYDALYVALAERLGGVLVTADVKAARGIGDRCPIDVIG
jgi:predicted nucleic acid-binding protein